MKKASQGDVDPSLFFRSRKDTDKDYFDRALGVMMGIFGNVKAQSVYYPVAKDDQGVLLDGSKYSYSVRFTADGIPPVKYFWSWTMYKLPQRWLVDNSIDRYNIGSATPGLETADDGSITIYFQTESPGKGRESNWLPTPNGPFWPVLRTYGPGKAIRKGTWKVPTIKRLTEASRRLGRVSASESLARCVEMGRDCGRTNDGGHHGGSGPALVRTSRRR
jgi:hypothetical protein